MKEVKEHKLKIFCDFDGTITKNDIWHSSFSSFVKDRESYNKVLGEYYGGGINAQELNLKIFDLLEDFSFEEFNKKLDEEELDDYFKEFLNFCKENDFEVFILSGGFDYYIEYLLKREGIDLRFYSTKLLHAPSEIPGKTNFTCEFPYADEHCQYCNEISKTNILINNTNDLYGEVSVYIGDSTSDFCVVSYADIVFAKGKLASHCWKNNITYFEYFTFKDIINKLDKLVSQRNIKHRQSAKTNRKDVLLGG